MCFSNSYKVIRSWCITIKCLFEESQSNEAHVLIKLETMFGSDKSEDKPELGLQRPGPHPPGRSSQRPEGCPVPRHLLLASRYADLHVSMLPVEADKPQPTGVHAGEVKQTL